MIPNPNFTIETFLAQVEEIRKNDGKGSWKRKGWSKYDHKLIGVLGKKVFRTPIDFLFFIPKNLGTLFTNFDLAHSLGKPLQLARKMRYCLGKMGIIKIISKKGKTLLFDFL